MGYPRRLLNPGETVVVDVRPHWWWLTGPAFLEAAIIAGAITAAVEPVSTWVVWLALAALAASTVWLAVRYAKWATTRLVVTSTRVIDRHGVLARNGREIPLSALSDIGYRQSIFGRVIGMGDVVLESAGRDGREVFPDLPHPAAIHNEIYRQLEAWRRPMASASASASAPAPAAPLAPAAPVATQVSITEQIEQLDDLRRRGLITDGEFEAKKTELLGRL